MTNLLNKIYMNAKIAHLLMIIFFGVVSTTYSQNKSIFQLADDYSFALKNYQKQKPGKSVENVLIKGKAVAGKLNDLESLSEADYLLLEKKMEGFTINREEIIFIEPDLKYFGRLSKTRGTRADIAFFTLMRQIKPDDVWAAYIEQQTDVTGCTIYGNGALTELYGKALKFKRTYPKAYINDIDKEVTAIIDEFAGNLCACGDRAGVLKEFRSFIKTFPKDENAPAIKKRLAHIEKEKDFRFNCQSG